MARKGMTRGLGLVDVGSLLHKQENERITERLNIFELNERTEE
jgi:hypothetical protein